MAKDHPVFHFEVRGLFSQVGIPACGAWSRDITSDPAFVRCEDCKATLDYAMARGNGDG